MYSEEQQQSLALLVACGDAAQAVVLFVVAEAALHHRCPQCADDASGAAFFRVGILGLGAFTDEVGGDAVLGAVASVVVVGIDGVCTDPLDLNAREFLLIIYALYEPHPLVESLERVVLDERYAVDDDVADLGAELHALVLLAADDGADVRAVDAHDAVFDLLVLEQIPLLAVHGGYGHEPLLLLGIQADACAVALAQPRPLDAQCGEQVQQPAQQLAGGGLLVAALLGVGQSGLVHIIILVAWLALAQFLAPLLQQGVQPVAALPQQLDVGREAQVALIARGVGQAQVQVAQRWLPALEQYPLQRPEVHHRGQTLADCANDLAVLDRIGRVDENAAEHLHVDAPLSCSTSTSSDTPR